MFEFSVEKKESDSFTYFAVYPGGTTTVDTGYKELILTMPIEQKPTAESLVDPAANVVVAKAAVEEQSSDITFDEVIHAAAIAKMTIKGLPEGVTPKTVKFENKTISGGFGVNIAGNYWYMYIDDTFKAAYGNSGTFSTSITVDQSEAQNPEEAWFALAPIGEISDFVVTVTGSDDKEYTKKVEGASLNFTAGKIIAFSVTVAEPEEAKDWSGTYAILLTNSSKAAYYIISSIVSSTNNLSFADIKYTGEPVEDATSDQIWVVEKQEDGSYTFQNGTQYLTCPSDGNVANMTSAKTYMTIEDNGDGSVYIHPQEYPARFLTKQSTFVRFYAYNANYYQNAYLVPISAKPAIAVGTVKGISAEGEEGTIDVTITNAESVKVAAYNEEEASTECTWLTNLSWNANTLSFTAAENTTGDERTAYIVITATNGDGESSKTIEIKQAAAGSKPETFATFTIKSGDVVSAASYAAYTKTVDNRGWVITFGGNNASVGTNSNNRSKCTLSSYSKYAVSPVTASSIASAFASTTEIANVSKIAYTFNAGSNQNNTKVYLLYSTDNNTFSQMNLTSGTQGGTISSGTAFEFEKCTGYFAVLFEATNTSGNWRIDDVQLTFTYSE